MANTLAHKSVHPVQTLLADQASARTELLAAIRNIIGLAEKPTSEQTTSDKAMIADITLQLCYSMREYLSAEEEQATSAI